MKRIINTYPINDHLILQPVHSNQFLVLNETAKTIWQSYQKKSSHEEICETLCRKYGISRRQAAHDVSSVINEIKSAGLFDPVERKEAIQTLKAFPDNDQSSECKPEKVFRAGYAFNKLEFIIEYGSPKLKESIHAFIAHLEKTPVKSSINIYRYDRSGSFLAVRKNGRLIAWEAEEYRAHNVLLHDILADAYPDKQFGAIIHAAAVETEKMCILLPAASGSGKSTLTAALLQAGFSYMGDDYIPLETGSFYALPVPFALSIKENSWPLLRESYPEIDSLPIFHRLDKTIKYLIPPDRALFKTSQGLPIKRIIYPQYDPDASAALHEISAATSFQNIIKAYSWIETDALCIAGFIDWLQRTKSYVMSYARLADAVRLIRNLLMI